MDRFEGDISVRVFQEERRGNTTATQAERKRDEGDEIGSGSEHGERERNSRLPVNEDRSARYAN